MFSQNKFQEQRWKIWGFCQAILFGSIHLILAQTPVQGPTTQPSREASFSLPEAIETALRLDPSIRIEETSVESAKGKARASSGEFDPAIQSSIKAGRERLPQNSINRLLDGTFTTDTEVIDQSLAVSKKFRNGISITPSFEVEQLRDNAFNPRRTANSILNLELDVPLLRGLGGAASASERAEYLNSGATELRYRHFVSQRVFQIAAQYWSLVAAKEEFQLLKEAVARTEKVRDMVNQLVELQEVAASDKIRQESQLAAIKLKEMISKQKLLQTKTGLEQAIGFPNGKELSLESTLDLFPDIQNEDLSRQATEHLIQEALEKRDDFAAAKIDVKRDETLERGGRNQLLPELTARLNGGYRGIHEGSQFANSYSAASENLTGLNWSGELLFSIPWGNDLAEGQLQDLVASLEKSRLTKENLDRLIRSNINQQVSDIGSYRDQLLQARRASELAFKAAKDRKALYQEGSATLIEINLSENDLVDALIQYNQAEANYYTTVARLRFETATLIHHHEKKLDIDLEDLTRLPPVSLP